MGLLDRIRGDDEVEAGADGSSRIAERFGSLVQRGGKLVDRVAEGVKEISTPRLVKDAADAQARGNLGAAFHLALEASEAQPDDIEVARLLWDVALAFDKADDARDAAVLMVRHHAAHGAAELAAQYFAELVVSSGPVLIEATTLVRIIPDLIARVEACEAGATRGDAQAIQNDPDVARHAVVVAMRVCVAPENDPLSPGIAMRLAELAQPFEIDVALEAAQRALEAEDVHEAKRAKLEALVQKLDPAAAPDLPEAELMEPELEAEAIVMIDDDGVDDEPVLEAWVEQEKTDEEALPMLVPLDEGDPARNHPARIQSPSHDELSEDEVDRMRDRIERAITGSN